MGAESELEEEYKMMRVARKSEECEVKIREETIEQVDAMKYLGVKISSDGSMEKEVEARIGSATQVIGGLSEIVLRRKELSRNAKLKVMNATMMPTLLYGCEFKYVYVLSGRVSMFQNCVSPLSAEFSL